MALGPLALRPSEVNRSTVAELIEMVDGHMWREDNEWERTAWLAANLLNISGKKVRHRVTVKKLLGRGLSPGQFLTPDQKEALMAAIKKSKAPDD